MSNISHQLPTFPEDFVISELLQSSVEFQKFYEMERKKIGRPIRWTQDLSLPEGIDYRSTRLPSGEYIIRLRRIPALIMDAGKIAHELEHFVLDAEGFPLTGATPENENLSSAINSMVADLLVNSRLKEYGFDLWKDYEAEIAEAKKQLSKFSTSPANRLGRIHWMVNYASNMLDWELASGGKGDNEFKTWFHTRYPDIADRGEKLLDIVKRIGYDTPEKQLKLFREIIRRFKLDGIVFL